MFERIYLNRLGSISCKNERRIFKLTEDICWHIIPKIEKMFSAIGDGYSSMELLMSGHTSFFCGYFESDGSKVCFPFYAVINKDNGSLLLIPINKRCKAIFKKAILLKDGEYQFYCGGSSPNEWISENELSVGFYCEKLSSSFSIDSIEISSVILWIPEKLIPDDSTKKALPYLSQPREFYNMKKVMYEMLNEQSKIIAKEE